MGRILKRHVIVAGIPRSGKTTLCLELDKLGFTHYKMDTIKRAINQIWDWQESDWYKVSPKMGKLINKILRENRADTVYNHEYYVIDTCHFLPCDVDLIEDDTLIVFLGYKDISVESKVKEMRENDKDYYWSNSLSDNELENMVRENVEFSEVLSQECKKNNVIYFDTSYNRDEVLKSVLDYIIENCTEEENR